MFFTLDPASLLVTSHFHEGLDKFPAEALAQEYYGDDVHKLVDIVPPPAASPPFTRRPTAIRAAVRGGSSTCRWGDEEMIARLRTKQGETWGALGLYREPGAPMFADREKEFLRAIGPTLAAGARRAMTLGEAKDPEAPDAPGLW